ncbi:uncharacterized protein LOC112518276 [Cynara cardunculus var. scolymus]|uniref:uncharacterized protein LOC112518276 n=1 Tax=Cynara cardunculus var. scolymus TaxID=59895 RepID=UPI000D62AB3B|nr:uncharacterized protein LOC112518276 [Cynara cardunculus var. scolymus]
MKGSLDSLIDKAQSAFIPGRRIMDNILMAHELVSGYQLSNGPPRCAFKIDIKKAYDTVDWRFLVVMLEGLGFHPVLVKWIREMVSTTSYSLSLNGNSYGFFHGGRGLRQGDVLSVEVLKKALFLFQCHSGLAPSLEKSEIYFGNVPSNIKEAILECLPFKLGSFPVRYLGVPLSQARLKLCDYAPLIAKVKGRIINWKSKFLSFGGRWDDLRGRCRLSWDVVCRPLDAGGLGIKRLSIWNSALLVKHVWDVVRHRDSLWVSWIYGQYLRSSHFWMVRKSSYWSWVFRKLLDLRSQLRRFMFSQIGDGRATNAWEDNWLSCGRLSAFISYQIVHSCGFSTSTTVRDLLLNWNGIWPDDWSSRFAELSSPLPLLNDFVRDKVLWGEDRNSAADFLVSNTCTLLEGDHPVVPWHKAVWFPGHIPKHAFCLWLACQGRLLTQDLSLCSRGYVLIPSPNQVEDKVCWVDYKGARGDFQVTVAWKTLQEKKLPTQDRISQRKHEPPDLNSIWEGIKMEVGLTSYLNNWEDILHRGSVQNWKSWSTVQRLGLSATVYNIWRERNRKFFDNFNHSEDKVIAVIKMQILHRMAWKNRKKIMNSNDM